MENDQFENKIYICIDNCWFDVTNYTQHPGGIHILRKYHLKNATNIFNLYSFHQEIYVLSLMEKYQIHDADLIKKLDTFLTK